jgi:cysteine desulfurase family protein (TIGR01976 family)
MHAMPSGGDGHSSGKAVTGGLGDGVVVLAAVAAPPPSTATTSLSLSLSHEQQPSNKSPAIRLTPKVVPWWANAMAELDVATLRKQYPALTRTQNGEPVAFLDGPAGSQVPMRVIDAVSHYLALNNANTHGSFVTSRESDEMLDRARTAVRDLVGAGDEGTVVFGPNMTSLTLSLSRALGHTWRAGDDVVVTRLDHDANITPWALAARDAGANVRRIPFHAEDTTLDLEALDAVLSTRTRLVAVGAASNATGTINAIAQICEMAHDHGAEVFVDAVHYAPHSLIDVTEWGCDYLACSAYKFFGPHVGILWGSNDALGTVPAYRVRPAGDALPGRWETGTQNHEGIAGTLEAIEYLAALGQTNSRKKPRRRALISAFQAITRHERALLLRLLDGLESIPDLRIYGITERDRMAERAPTISFTHPRHSPRAIAAELGKQGIFVWDGNFYAIEVSEALGLEPEGMVRVGLLHYNTKSEVDRLIRSLKSLLC